MSVSFKDFQPINTWEPDTKGSTWANGEPEYLIDMTTGRKYWNESENCVRFKCFLLTLGTPIVHTIVSLAEVASRIVKLVSFAHFRIDEETNIPYSERFKDAATDFLKNLTAPISLIGLELAAIYGIITPYNGRKLYASIERAQYGGCILAPCFQPEPEYHAFGGNPKEKNAF